MRHLENLIMEIYRYLPDMNLEAQPWVRNSFLSKVDNLSEDVAGLQKELFDLHHDQFIGNFFPQRHLESSGTHIKEKPIIGNKAMIFLLSFSTTYLCEQGFSALTVVKTKARNCLSPGNNLRVALSKIEPCIE